ncbi:MAG: hypothetical protein PVJ47_05725 [Thiohalocapsa sp.]
MADTYLADVTYLDIISVGGAAAVGDLWHRLQIDYSDSSAGGVTGIDFTFSQDTDNDIRAVVPVLGTLPLLGVALAGLGLLRRRRR